MGQIIEKMFMDFFKNEETVCFINSKEADRVGK
jgi:hypothetical protein